MGRLTIRARLILLSSALLVVLVGTNAYLTHKLSQNSLAMEQAAELVKGIELANNAQIAFGEVRYWMTDLAVSELVLSETNAKAARVRMERYLDQLAPRKPIRVAAVREELGKYADLAASAVDEYTADRRVIGNSLLAQARVHSIAVEQLLTSVVAELNGEDVAARDRVMADAAAATKLSQVIVAAAVLVGAFFTFLVLQSIAGPLRRLVLAMNGLNAGDTEVEIPAAGSNEIGAMARTLAAFRDTMTALRQSIAQFEALRAVGRAVGSTLDLETVLGIIVARAVEFSNAAAGAIYEYDEQRQQFRFRASHGLEPESSEQFRATVIHPGQGAIGQAARTGAPVEVADVLDEQELAGGLWGELGRAGYRAMLAMPLLHEERILGGLLVLRREPGNFSKEVVGLVEAFGTQSALAVRNAKLFDEQRRREQELREAHDELQAAQANLIQAEKMASLGQLTAGIAHEIKNPLNFVNNFAGLSVELLDELKEAAGPALARLDPDKRAEVDETIEMLTGNLEKIAEHGRRADGIVKSMLLHSRGGSGERQTVDLNALVEEALNLAYHGARAQDQNFNITLERRLDRGLAPVELVPQDMTRVLLNLFGNGFYAAAEKSRSAEGGFRPTLTVTTGELGEAVEIRVRDNGTGVPPELRDRLFQPFFTTKPTGEGTGLGLSISYDIVTRQHGGTIEVASEPGQFTEFTVRLPRGRAAASAGRAA